jgi:hypothetical protein
MAITYKELISAQTLTATGVSYYVAPAETQAAIHAVSVYNPTGAAVTVNLYRVPVGGASGPTNRIASRLVGAGATVSLPDAINHKLAPGSQLFADGLGCNLNASGVEFLPSN